MTTMSNTANEVTILLESLLGNRMKIDSMRKKEISGNRTKYTIIVKDSAIPDKKPTKATKKPAKKETPKEKVIIQKQANTPAVPPKSPIKPNKPDMADIHSMGPM